MVILIVEDDIGLRYLLWRVLRDDGHTVLSTGDGEAALKISRTTPGPIDLLLTDLAMPRINGIELHKAIVVERPEIKVIMMSGDLNVKEKLTTAGLPFLQKPFPASALLQTIQAMFGRTNPLG